MSMARGLPYSLLVHILALLLIVVYGNYVAQNTIQPSRSIPFQLMYQSRPAVTVEQPPPDEELPPENDPAPVVVEESPPELPPKELPKPKPDPVKPQEKPQEKPPETVRNDPVPADPAPAQETPAQDQVPATAATLGPSVGATDSDFPYEWYLTRIEGLIASKWHPRQLGFGQRAMVSCAVHFVIGSNGSVSGVTLIDGSGIGVYDREALRAVMTTRLPRLPQQYSSGNLGVTFIFNLEPGS